MTNRILVKKGAGTPSPDDLEVAELALNTLNGELYTKLSDDSVVLLNDGADDVDLSDYVKEAPEDGKQYARQSAAWAEIQAAGNGNPVVISDDPPANPEEGDLWYCSKEDQEGLYCWDGAVWFGTESPNSAGLEEAPEDGKQYARRNASWSEVDGAGAGMVISETEPTDKVEGMQWLNPANGLVLFWDDAKWLQMPGSQDGADGSDGLWTDNGGGSISYSGNVSVSDGNLSVTSSTDTAIINLNNSIGNYEIANNQYGSIAINYNGDEQFVLASNADVFLKGAINAAGATITGDLLASKADAGANAVAVGTSAGKTSQGDYAVAFGPYSGQTNQSTKAVSFGWESAVTGQGESAVAVGPQAGRASQGFKATALGVDAGYQNQGDHAIAIGNSAGRINQGQDSIAIGRVAAKDNQAPNGIIICSGGVEENNTNQHHIVIRSGPGKFLYYNGSDNWKFSGGSVSGISFRQNGSPVIDAKGLIKTLSTLRNATKDETTLEGMRDALADAIGGLIENLEHEIATMPVPEPEASTQEIAE